MKIKKGREIVMLSKEVKKILSKEVFHDEASSAENQMDSNENNHVGAITEL